MNPYHEKRGEIRNHYVTTVLIKNLKTGKISRARMVNSSPDGMFIETGVLLNAGEIIEIGIENSPYILFEDAIDCYRATVIRRKGLASGAYKYGYGLQIRSVGQGSGPHITDDQAVRGWRNRPQEASTATEMQMTTIASTCQVVSPWLRNTTVRKAAITGLRKKR